MQHELVATRDEKQTLLREIDSLKLALQTKISSEELARHSSAAQVELSDGAMQGRRFVRIGPVSAKAHQTSIFPKVPPREQVQEALREISEPHRTRKAAEKEPEAPAEEEPEGPKAAASVDRQQGITA